MQGSVQCTAKNSIQVQYWNRLLAGVGSEKVLLIGVTPAYPELLHSTVEQTKPEGSMHTKCHQG